MRVGNSSYEDHFSHLAYKIVVPPGSRLLCTPSIFLNDEISTFTPECFDIDSAKTERIQVRLLPTDAEWAKSKNRPAQYQETTQEHGDPAGVDFPSDTDKQGVCRSLSIEP